MAHLLRAQPDATWVRGYVSVGTDLRTIDQNSFVAINGDDGGTWTPAAGASLVIGGAGLIIAGPSILANVSMGASLVTVTASSPLIFGRGTSDDVFGYASPLTYTLPTVLFEHFATLADSVTTGLNYPTGPAGIRTLALAARFACELRTYNGARLTSVTLNFSVGETHANLPNVVPAMRVYAVDVNGTIFPLRASDGTTTDTNGFQPISTATTGAAYSASLAIQTFVYTCNQNQTIDLSKYSYFVEIIDESGTGAWATTGNIFASAVGVFDTILGYDGQN